MGRNGESAEANQAHSSMLLEKPLRFVRAGRNGVGGPVSPDGNRVRKIRQTERCNGHLGRTSERPNKILGKLYLSGVNLRWARIYYESSLVSIEKSSDRKCS